MTELIKVFKYNGSMVEKLECAANKLNEVIWLPGNFKVDKGSSLFVDKPPTPKNEAADKKEEDDKPKKKKMNLKWDEEADIFHKTEGMKPIGAEELLAFNKIYNDELNAKVQKEKDAADKLEKKIAKAAESGKEGLVQVKGPTVLQRGTFKRGEKVEKDPVLAQGDKDGGSQTDKAIKKGDGPEAANKGQKNDKVENQPKKQKKDKDQIKNPDDLSKNGQAEQKKPQPQKGPNQANPNKQSKKETKDQTPSQKCDSQSNQEKSVLTMTPTAEGGDLKTVNNQRKKKPKAQNKKQPQQGDQGLQNLGQFLSMNFDPSIVQNFHNPNMPPQGYYPNFPQGGFQMGQNSLMNPNFQGRENFFQQDNMPYETANFYPNLMQQMPFYGRQQSRGSTDMDFDLGANTNQIDELQLRKMLNLGPQIGNNKQYTDSQKSKGNSK